MVDIACFQQLISWIGNNSITKGNKHNLDFIDWTVGFPVCIFYTCDFGALYSLLFCMSQGFVLKDYFDL